MPDFDKLHPMQAATEPNVLLYVGAVVDGVGECLGTCFQVGPRIAVTAWNVVAYSDSDEQPEPILVRGANGLVTEAFVLCVGREHDLAVLQLERPLVGTATNWFDSGLLRPGAPVEVVGHPHVDDKGFYRLIERCAAWNEHGEQSTVALTGSAPHARPSGMSGSPVLTADGAIVGMVGEPGADADASGPARVVSSRGIATALRRLVDLSFDRPRVSETALLAITSDCEAIARRLLGGRASLDRPGSPRYPAGPVRMHATADSLLDVDVERLMGDLLQTLGRVEPGLVHARRGEPLVALASDAIQLAPQVEVSIDERGRFASEHLAATILERARTRAGDAALGRTERIVLREVLTRCVEALMRHHLSSLPVARSASGSTRHPVTDAARHRTAASSAAEEFEGLYLTGIGATLERVTVGGLTLSRRQKEDYRLSTSYVNLAMHMGATRPQPERQDGLAMRTGMTVEQVLQGRRLVLIEGPAGAGKTTLLRRLALHCVHGTVPSALTDLQGCVPFLLPARKLDPRNLPQPEDFVGVLTDYAGRMPPGWVTDILLRGRGLVLLDGIDEVAASLRPRIVQWATNLATSFRETKFVFTTRPSTIDGNLQDELRSRGFASASIEPMSSHQVDEFIQRWHLPPDHETDRYSPKDLQDAAESLRRTLLGRQDLRRLATTPLLCAMLCALNFNSGQYLPRSRTQLYRNSLEMLLERRDLTKQVEVAEDFHLDHEQCSMILRRLAYWMANQGSRWIHREVALREVSEVLPVLRISDTSVPQSEAVLDYLVERSGVLQEPAVDNIEFTHPSFQDFLAASETVAKTHTRILITNVGDPLYRDLIVMAIAISSNTNAVFYDDLLDTLVEVAEEKQASFKELQDSIAAQDEPALDPANLVVSDAYVADLNQRMRAVRAESLYIWFLLAAAVSDLGIKDDGIDQRIAAATRQYLPPNSLTDAQMLADVGAFVLDALGEVVATTRLTAAQEIATVQVAALVSGEEALPLITRFRGSENRAVQEILLDAMWNFADREAYVADVLAHVPAGAGLTAVIKEARCFGIVSSLPCVGTIGFLDTCTDDDFQAVQQNDFVKELVLTESAITDLAPIHRFPAVEVVDLADSEEITDLTDLAQLRRLRRLDVSGTRISSLDPVRDVTELRYLNASDTQVRSIENLCGSRSLEELLVPHTPLTSLAGVGGMVGLRRLDVRNTPIRSLEPLRSLPGLEDLDVGLTKIRSLRALERVRTLQVLRMGSADDVRDLRPLLSLPNLREVYLDGAEEAFDGVAELRGRGVAVLVNSSAQ